MKISGNNRADSQTGSERGCFKRGDAHPFMEDRYFRTYAKQSCGSYKECWLTKDSMERHEESVKRNGRERRDLANARNQKYIDNNKELIKKRRAELYQERREDPVYRLKGICRSRLRVALDRKGFNKDCKTFKTLGANPDTIAKHLESMFEDGMSWDNMGSEWHVDHIVPLNCATTLEGVYKLSHYTNLQPLWAGDNIRKRDNLVLCQN